MLPIELLHGVTFGLAWTAGTANSSRISPPGLETTTQAIFQVGRNLWFAVLPYGLPSSPCCHGVCPSMQQYCATQQQVISSGDGFGRLSITATCSRRQGLFSGVGFGLGGVVGGVIYSRLGAPAVFASAAMVLAVGWCACMAVQALARCLRGRERRT